MDGLTPYGYDSILKWEMTWKTGIRKPGPKAGYTIPRYAPCACEMGKTLLKKGRGGENFSESEKMGSRKQETGMFILGFWNYNREVKRTN